MPRVSADSLEKLNNFFESLPSEARSKCALCSETLTHIVKLAEVETGAGTATVTRVLAEKINEDAAPGDRVTPLALRDRVRTADQGRRPSQKEKMAQCHNNQPPADDYTAEEKRAIVSGEIFNGQRFANMAIEQLRRIKDDDPDLIAALVRVQEWINNRLQGHSR